MWTRSQSQITCPETCSKKSCWNSQVDDSPICYLRCYQGSECHLLSHIISHKNHKSTAKFPEVKTTTTPVCLTHQTSRFPWLQLSWAERKLTVVAMPWTGREKSGGLSEEKWNLPKLAAPLRGPSAFQWGSSLGDPDEAQRKPSSPYREKAQFWQIQ